MTSRDDSTVGRLGGLAVRELLAITLIVSACSLLYELLIAQTLSLLAGNTVVWYSLTVGAYRGALPHLERDRERHPDGSVSFRGSRPGPANLVRRRTIYPVTTADSAKLSDVSRPYPGALPHRKSF